MTKKQKSWESYEQVASYLLNEIATEFGLKGFEGKQKLLGTRTGTEWEIDAKGISDNDEIIFIVECRRYTKSRLNQEKLGGLVFRILDTGAQGGIIVSPMGLQEGAAKIAKAENIFNVILDKNSTRADYVLKFLEKTRVGKHLEGEINFKGLLRMKVIRSDGTVDEIEEV